MIERKNIMSKKFSNASKVAAHFAEAVQDQKFSRTALDFAFFQFPGSRMRNEHSAQAGMHSRVDVAARTVAHHPAMRFHDFELFDHAFVQAGIFFQHDFDGIEITPPAGTLHFGSLLGGLALGDHNQAMMLGQVSESFWRAFEYVRRCGFQFRCHSLDLFNKLALRRVTGKFQVSLFQRASEAAHAVTVLADIAALGLVQDVADIFARITKMFELGNEVVDGLLKENIVFPEGVVRVDQYCVPGHARFSRSPKRKKKSILTGGQRIYRARFRKWVALSMPNCQTAEALRVPAATCTRISRAIFCKSPKRARYS